MENIQKRNDWIDIVRGMAIFAVVLGHVSRNSYVVGLVYSFHLSIFFFTGGYLYKRRNVLENIKTKVFQLLLPYLIWGAISIVYYAVLYAFVGDYFSRERIGALFIKLLYGSYSHIEFNTPIWFLPCFFMVTVISNIVVEACQYVFGMKDSAACLTRGTLVVISALAVCCMLLRGVVDFIDLPFGIVEAIQWIPFYMAGIIVRQVEFIAKTQNDAIGLKINNIIFKIIPFVGMAGLVAIQIVDAEYMCYGYISGFIGIISLSILSRNIGHSQILEVWGKSSIGILCIHVLVKDVIVNVMLRVLPIQINNILDSFSILFCVGVTVVSVWIYRLISAWCPWMFGKSSEFHGK